MCAIQTPIAVARGVALTADCNVLHDVFPPSDIAHRAICCFIPDPLNFTRMRVLRRTETAHAN